MRRHLESARAVERQLSDAVLANRAALSRNPGHIQALAGLGASLIARAISAKPLACRERPGAPTPKMRRSAPILQPLYMGLADTMKPVESWSSRARCNCRWRRRWNGLSAGGRSGMLFAEGKFRQRLPQASRPSQ